MNEEKITTSAKQKTESRGNQAVKGLGCLQDKRYDDILIFGSSQEMVILPQMNIVPLRTLQINRKWSDYYDNPPEYGNPGSSL